MTERAKALLAEKARRDKFKEAVEKAAKKLFPKQRAVFASKAKRVVLKCGRRSGKTYTAEVVVLRGAAEHPGAIIPVCERTLTCSAATTFWKALQEFDAEHKLGIEFKHTAKEAICPNGAVIKLFGVDTKELADKLRGEPYPLVYIDECGTYRPSVLEYLVDDVLTPSLVDYDAPIYMSGTPGPRKKGFWFDVCEGRYAHAWEQHHWTLLDNPELGKKPYQRTREWRANWLKDYIISKGWLDRDRYAAVDAEEVIRACEHPTFMREYMGEWIDSLGEMMYEFDWGRNVIAALPTTDGKRPWKFGLGIDLGYNDPTAFVVTATRKRDPVVYVVESYAESHLIPSAIAAHIDRLKARYGRFSFVVGDTGGAGKLAVEEINQKYGHNILPAQKRDKRVFVEHCNGSLRTGRIQFVKAANQALCEDLSNLPWDEDREDAAEGYADHLPDAHLYQYRYWTNTREGFGDFDPAVVGSAEWLRAQDEIEEQYADELGRKLRAEKNDDGYDLDYESD